jgi:hypothetical protein
MVDFLGCCLLLSVTVCYCLLLFVNIWGIESLHKILGI